MNISRNKLFIMTLLGIYFQIDAHVITIHSEEEFIHLIEKNNKVIAQFSSEHCSVCRLISKPYHLASEKNNSIAFAYIDKDDVPKLAKKYEIKGLPTFVYFKDGHVVQKEVGASAPTFNQDIESSLEKYLPDTAAPLHSEPSGLEKIKEIFILIFLKIKELLQALYKFIFG